MEVSLSLLLLDHPGFLQEIVVDVTTDGVALEVEVDVHVLSKPRGVVIPIGLGVAECFQNVIGLEENVFDSFYLILLSHVGHLEIVQFSVKLFVLNGGDLTEPPAMPEICCKTNLSDVSHYNLAGFSLPRARLSWYYQQY